MAVNVNVYDLQNYPDNNKTVTIDIKQVTPIGYEGDEQWVVSATTTAYSDIAARTAISDIFILEMKGGWAKSSGLVGAPFTINTTKNKLRLRMDADIASGTDPQVQSGYWELTLTSGTNQTGDDLAADMETQIRDLADNTDMDATYMLSYMNSSVEFTDNKFKIISGSISETYTGQTRSSVDINTGSFSNTANSELGFDLSMDTVSLASLGIKEVTTVSGYGSGDTLDVNTGLLGVDSTLVGQVFYIDDGSSSEYFYATTATTETALKVLTSAGTLLVNTYGTNAKVQKVRWNDPDGLPTNYYQDVDAGVRWAIKTLANQIDYSS